MCYSKCCHAEYSFLRNGHISITIRNSSYVCILTVCVMNKFLVVGLLYCSFSHQLFINHEKRTWKYYVQFSFLVYWNKTSGLWQNINLLLLSSGHAVIQMHPLSSLYIHAQYQTHIFVVLYQFAIHIRAKDGGGPENMETMFSPE